MMVVTMKKVANAAKEEMAMRQCFTKPQVEQGWASMLDGLFETSQGAVVVTGVCLVVGIGNLLGTQAGRAEALVVVDTLVGETSVVEKVDGETLEEEILEVDILDGETLVVDTLVGETSVVEIPEWESLVGETSVGEPLVGETLVVETMVVYTLVVETLVGGTLVGEMVVRTMVVGTLVVEMGKSVENELVGDSAVDLNPAVSGICDVEMGVVSETG